MCVELLFSGERRGCEGDPKLWLSLGGGASGVDGEGCGGGVELFSVAMTELVFERRGQSWEG